MTKTLAAKIPALWEQAGMGDDIIVYARYSFAFGSWTWFLAEFDPDSEDGMCFGKVYSGRRPEGELAYFSLGQLSDTRVNYLMTLKDSYRFDKKRRGVKRDTNFEATRMGDIKNPFTGSYLKGKL